MCINWNNLQRPPQTHSSAAVAIQFLNLSSSVPALDGGAALREALVVNLLCDAVALLRDHNLDVAVAGLLLLLLRGQLLLIPEDVLGGRNGGGKIARLPLLLRRLHLRVHRTHLLLLIRLHRLHRDLDVLRGGGRRLEADHLRWGRLAGGRGRVQGDSPHTEAPALPALLLTPEVRIWVLLADLCNLRVLVGLPGRDVSPPELLGGSEHPAQAQKNQKTGPHLAPKQTLLQLLPSRPQRDYVSQKKRKKYGLAL